MIYLHKKICILLSTLANVDVTQRSVLILKITLVFYLRQVLKYAYIGIIFNDLVPGTFHQL